MVPEKYFLGNLKQNSCFFSVRNSTTGDGMALDKQVLKKCETRLITLHKKLNH